MQFGERFVAGYPTHDPSLAASQFILYGYRGNSYSVAVLLLLAYPLCVFMFFFLL